MATHERDIAAGSGACIVAVQLPDGTCPATEYMKQARCKAQFEARFQVLALRGRLANPDQMRKLGGRVWEVKVNQGPGRRIYGCWDGKVFVLTHGGNKPRARGVATEVARAERLYDSWFQEEHKEDERP